MDHRWLYMLVVVVPVVLCTSKTTDPLRSREARPYVDLEARKDYYRAKAAAGCIQRPPKPDQPLLPTVPKSFTTELEIALQESDQLRILKGKEMYDGFSERGVLDYTLASGVFLTRPMVLSEVIHYNIPVDEALFILTNEGCSVTGQENCATSKFCEARKIEDVTAELQELFGISAVSGVDGFMGATGILQFGPQYNFSAKPIVETCHGIDCDVFETCLEKPEENATLLYTYYWSNNNWNVQNNHQPVPIAVEIFGSEAFDGHTTKEVMLRYDFFNFKREFRPSRYQLEAPKDTYCHGRKTYLAPPRSVLSFSYQSEHVMGLSIPLPAGDNDTMLLRLRGVFPQDEWYDWETRVARVDYLPFYVIGDERRFENWTSRVQDFNQGLAYVMKPRLNWCDITYIENTTSSGDVTVGPDGNVMMTSPWNFEDLDEPIQYNGVHFERGMETDVWVGIKKNRILGINETYVWYFASPLTHEVLGRSSDLPTPVLPTMDKVPVKMEKYITTLEMLPHVLYNIYGYDEKMPHTHIHDVSLCYSPDQMRHFKLDFPANSLNKTYHLRESLKYGAMRALAEAGRVSPVRINRVEVEEAPDAVVLTFSVLERPDVVGDVVIGGEESSKDTAIELIHNTVDMSQLVVMVKINIGLGNLAYYEKIVALPGTLREVTRDDGKPRGKETLVGYNPGDMAGLAVGMIILGGIVGYGAIYLYSNKK